MSFIEKIPEKYRIGFNSIFLIEDRDFSSIIDGLSLSSLSSSTAKLIKQISLVKDIPRGLIGDIIISTSSIVAFLEKNHTPEEVASEVFNTIAKEKLFEWAIDKNKEKFVDRLSALLGAKQIYYASKGSYLMFEYQNVFLNARLITDFRPVFDTEIDTEIIAGLIIHNIHIRYKNDQEDNAKDIFLALDSSDIIELKRLLDRAEKKELSLRSIIKKSGIENLNE